MTALLAVADLLFLSRDLGVGPVRDASLLDSAAHRPRSMLFGDVAYPAIDLKAASLLESIVCTQAIVDANKCLGWLAVIVFYGLNDVTLDAPDDPAYELVIDVARGTSTLDDSAHVLAGW